MTAPLHSNVTPVILTFNEEANIPRSIASLRWAERIVIVDSGSTDRTVSVARRFPNVQIYSRRFDNHASQWLFATTRTDISSRFILALDADMVASGELVNEIADLTAADEVDGAWIAFDYAIHGVRLFGSVYPPQLRLLRLGAFEIRERGHTQEFVCRGRTARLRARLIHDDRKPFESWIQSQTRYSEIELSRLVAPERGRRFRSWMRKHVPLTPALVSVWSYIRAGALFKGAAARRYALERLIYESMLRYRIENGILEKTETDDHDRQKANT